jgi:hypothetical protein
MSGNLIRLRYTTIDGLKESKVFYTLAAAKIYAERRLGKAYDVSTAYNYAVDMYGTGKLSIVGGTTWFELLGYKEEF